MTRRRPTLTPAKIVAELDRYIVGQRDAKRAVAIALRNRWRRQQVEGELRDEIAPKNIIMIGPTGVGKTEIARRLAKLARAPFVKVEASKFTEVGYVGRDVESMVRDLVEARSSWCATRRPAKVRPRAKEAAEERLLDLLLPRGARRVGFTDRPASRRPAATRRARSCARMLRDGKLDDREVEVEVADDANPLDVRASAVSRASTRSALSASRTCSATFGRKTQAPEAEGARGAARAAPSRRPTS